MFCILAVNHKRSIERERERERMAEAHNEPEINIELQPQLLNFHNEPEISIEIQPQLLYFQRLLNSNREINEQDRESFKELLRTNPELAETLDSQRRSLLHLASDHGHIEIVKALIQVKPEMCQACDQDGANPLHVAAMRGKVDVLEQFLQAKPHAARAARAYRVDRGEKETILHLCVKCNQLRCLEILEKYFKDEEFVNLKDNAGNTILHLAVAEQRFEIIEYVLRHTKIDVNAVNARKQTAMDILLLGKEKGMPLKGLERTIQFYLKLYDAKTAREADILDPTEIAEKRSGIIVAAVLMATLAFQAGVAPPGGVWQDDSDGHKSGKAVMGSNYPILYSFFLCYNILGFISSLGTLVLMMTDLPFQPGRYTWWTFMTMSTTITSIAITYSISLVVVSPPRKREPITKIVLAPAASVVLLLLLIAIIAGMIKRTNALVRVIRRTLAREAFDRQVGQLGGLWRYLGVFCCLISLGCLILFLIY